MLNEAQRLTVSPFLGPNLGACVCVGGLFRAGQLARKLRLFFEPLREGIAEKGGLGVLSNTGHVTACLCDYPSQMSAIPASNAAQVIDAAFPAYPW